MLIRPNRKKSIVLVLSIAILITVGLVAYPLTIVQREYFLERRGGVAGIEDAEFLDRDDGGTVASVEIHSTAALTVRIRLLLPASASDGQVPVILLVGGHRTGKDAVDLINRPLGIAYAAIDYPYAGRHKLSGVRQIAATIPEIQSALLDTPPALMLAMDWLAQQPWFDSDQAELVGVSLGVPFAAVAGALDTRFSRVWLIHGASDNFEWLMHAARDRVHNRLLRQIAVRSALFIAYGNSFDTTDWVRQIAPRPVVVVLARDDDRVPVQSAEEFIAGSGHVTFIWTDGQHVGPDREGELHQLIKIVQENIESAPDPG
jgi:hypothetical protein